MKFDFDLNLLPVLEALVLEESVSRAADSLNLTQSAVSHALRRLRSYFNDPLFVRSGNRMLPTPRAQAIAPIVSETLEGLRRQMNPSVYFEAEQSTNEFTINTTDVGEITVAPAIINKVRQLAPKCQVKFVLLRPRDAASALEQGDIDLSIGPVKYESDRFFQQLLLEQKLTCLISRSHYGDIESFESCEQFSDLPHVAISPFRRNEDAYEWIFRDRGVTRNFVCMMRSFVAAPLLVAQSDIIATVPDILPQKLGLPNIVTVPPPFASPTLSVWQHWNRRYNSDPANMWLRRVIYSLFCDIRLSSTTAPEKGVWMP